MQTHFCLLAYKNTSSLQQSIGISCELCLCTAFQISHLSSLMMAKVLTEKAAAYVEIRQQGSSPGYVF